MLKTVHQELKDNLEKTRIEFQEVSDESFEICTDPRATQTEIKIACQKEDAKRILWVQARDALRAFNEADILQ